MLPLLFDIREWPVGLVGAGEAAVKRLDLLKAAGAGDLRVFAPKGGDLATAAEESIQSRLPTEDEVALLRLLFVAGLDEATTTALTTIARRHRVVVNAEDDLANCDVHVPAIVRRGDLVLTVSTGGQSPGVARLIRERLERDFDESWADRLDHVSALRRTWRTAGMSLAEISRRTRDEIKEKGWL